MKRKNTIDKKYSDMPKGHKVTKVWTYRLPKECHKIISSGWEQSSTYVACIRKDGTLVNIRYDTRDNEVWKAYFHRTKKKKSDLGSPLHK